MALSRIVKDVQEAVDKKNNWLLEQCFNRLSSDHNSYIIDDSVEETQLNLLHLLSGFDNSSFILNAIRRWLCFDKVNINFQGTIEGNSGITAAHIAVLNHNIQTLKLLIEFECDLFLCDSYGNNVQDYAKLEENDFPQLLEIVNGSFENWFQKRPYLEVTLTPSKNDEYFQRCISPIHSDNEEKLEVQILPRFKASPQKHNQLSEACEKQAGDLHEEIEALDQLKKMNIGNDDDLKPIRLSRTQDLTNGKEIYFHEDKEKNIEFVEERTCGTNFLKGEQIRQTGSQSSQETDISNTSIETVIDDLILKMTNSQLREHFCKTGHNPGPINDKNRRLYQKKANRALISEKNCQELEEDRYSKNLRSSLKLKLSKYRIDFDNIFQRRFCFKEAMRLEQILVKEFSYETESLFSGSEVISNKPEVTFFVYLLLDPEITNNLPERANLSFENMFFVNQENKVGSLLESLDPNLFVTFITSIFYVGKGKNNRPYQHFYDAFNLKKCKRDPKMGSPKTQRILDIWSKKRGPISLHCFNGIDSNEALAREFLMIETLGLQNLTNKISGNSRIKTRLNSRQRETLGTYLLYKAFIILLLNGERQIKCSKNHRF